MSTADRHMKEIGETIASNLGGGGVREALAGTPAPAPAEAGPSAGRSRDREAAYLDVDRIIPDPLQPRKEFSEDELKALADSLKRHGQLQSVRVRYSREHDRYVLISGERRWRAARLGGIPQLAVRIIDGELTPAELLEAQLVENIHRQDLNAVELATAYQALIDKHGWNVTVLAQELSISAGSVTRTLSLLRLPEAAKDFVRGGTLAASVAYEIARLDGAEEQAALAHRVVKDGLSREAAVAVVQRKIGRKKAKSAGKPSRRVVCPLENGISVVVSASAEELTLDGLISALETVLKKARKARGQGLAVEKLPSLLKAPAAKDGPEAGSQGG